MDTPRQIHVDSTWVLCQHVEDQISTNFHIISVYFFDVISIFENATLFPRTFFDVILMVQKSTLFPRTFVSAISMIEKSAFFPRNFFDVLLMVEKSPLFPRTFVGVISIVEKSTLFLRTFFNVICLVEICTLFLTNVFNLILMCKDSTLFLVSCKLMKTFEKVFFCVCNFKQLALARLFYLSFSSKSFANIRHFSRVNKSRIFKILNLRKKADRNFSGIFLKYRFRHLKLYSNPPG